MKQKSKCILGLHNRNRQERHYFTDEEKHRILKEYFSSKVTKRSIWEKYTGQTDDHGHLLRWMRQLGYEPYSKKPIFVEKTNPMKSEENKEQESFENLQLKKRLEELEKQLKDAQMKAIAYSTMIDIAEKELKINIRKKYNTKP